MARKMCYRVYMSIKGFNENPRPEQPEASQAEKEARFQELLRKKEELVASVEEGIEQGVFPDDDEFMEMEMATQRAAEAARDAGNHAEYKRLMAEHSAMMAWREKGEGNT